MCLKPRLIATQLFVLVPANVVYNNGIFKAFGEHKENLTMKFKIWFHYYIIQIIKLVPIHLCIICWKISYIIILQQFIFLKQEFLKANSSTYTVIPVFFYAKAPTFHLSFFILILYSLNLKGTLFNSLSYQSDSALD